MFHVIKARRGSPSVSARLPVNAAFCVRTLNLTRGCCNWGLWETDTAVCGTTLWTLNAPFYLNDLIKKPKTSSFFFFFKFRWSFPDWHVLWSRSTDLHLAWSCLVYKCARACLCVWVLKDDSNGTLSESLCSPKRHPSLGSFVLGGAAKVSSWKSSLCARVCVHVCVCARMCVCVCLFPPRLVTQ